MRYFLIKYYPSIIAIICLAWSFANSKRILPKPIVLPQDIYIQASPAFKAIK